MSGGVEAVIGEWGRLHGGEEGGMNGRVACALGEVAVGDVDDTRGAGEATSGGDPWSPLSKPEVSNAPAPSSLLSQEPKTEVRCSEMTDEVDGPETVLGSRGGG